MTTTATPRPLIRGFVVGEFGKPNVITLKNFSGVVQDVSSYTTRQVISRSPDGRKTITCEGIFVTNGSDGLLMWSYSSGDPLDRAGIWEGQAVLSKTGGKILSYVFNMEVDKGI